MEQKTTKQENNITGNQVTCISLPQQPHVAEEMILNKSVNFKKSPVNFRVKAYQEYVIVCGGERGLKKKNHALI